MQPIHYSSLSEEEVSAVRSVARGLSYFARERAYGYIDRVANAFSVTTLRQVLTEFLRDLKSEQDRGAEVFMPSAKDVETFLKLAERDLSIAKVVASLALAYSWTPRGGQGTSEKSTGGGG
jgi:intergrase/recombinase